MSAVVLRKGLLQSFREVHRFKHTTRAAPTILQPLPEMLKGMPPKEKEIASKSYKHTNSYLQVLGNGTDTGETTPSVLLFFDSYRYVFNVGEGFQRYCFQHRLKIGKLNGVFFTRMSTEAAGGVPGLFITLSEYGIHGSAGPLFSVYGPMKLDRFMNALKTFVSVPIEGLGSANFGSEATAGLLGEPLVSNEQVVIRPITLLPQSAKTSQRRSSFSMMLTFRDFDSNDRRGVVPVACYVCQLAEVKGKFLPQKAKELGVKVGPDFTKLVDGMCVVAEDGQVVHPHQVMEPTLPGPTVIIVDCPDDSYTATLFSASGFDAYREEREGDLVMIHLGPFDVVSGEDYDKWMASFQSNVEHIFVNERATNATAIMRKAAVVQSKLNLVDEKYFPLPKTITSQGEWDRKGVILGKDLLRYHLKPLNKKGTDDTQLLIPFDYAKLIADFKEQEQEPASQVAIEAFRERRKTNGRSETSTLPNVDPNELEITFLGTGSAIPSKYRNVTGIYLDFFERGSMIVDCGEGSYGQLIRRFGKKGAEDAIKKLKCVWISHIHADHHIGLPTVLRQRRKLVDVSAPPLLVIGPPVLRSTMQSYEQMEPLRFVYLLNASTVDDSPAAKKPRLENKESLGALASVKEALNLRSITSFLVDHCAHAYGVSIVGQSGWKVVFSGDTVPCASVLEHANDATLLIHEATFEEDMKAEAVLKKHSTTRDAVKIATEARAYRTILTHFSQRYPKIPVIDADASAGICVAFDLMSVNLSDLEMLPYTIAPCKGLFHAEEGDTEEPEASLESAVVH